MNIAVQNTRASVNITTRRCPHDAKGGQETRNNPKKEEKKNRKIQHHACRLKVQAAVDFYRSKKKKER